MVSSSGGLTSPLAGRFCLVRSILEKMIWPSRGKESSDRLIIGRAFATVIVSPVQKISWRESTKKSPLSPVLGGEASGVRGHVRPKNVEFREGI